jgi:hypothetical protein
MTKWHRLMGRERRKTISVNPGSSSFRMWMIFVPIVLLMAPLSGCSGKKRPFASGSVIDETRSDTGLGGTDVRQGAGEPLAGDDGEGFSESQAGQESETTPGTFVGPNDGGAEQAVLPTSMTTCGDACSGECIPGATECASLTDKIECEIDALWGQPVACENVCLDGACAGECPPGESECVSTTRFRSCSELGTWSEPADCDDACVGAACGGECKPGQTRCASTTGVQTCSDQGQWGPTIACQNACVGDACTGECVPGAARCFSETQLQTCNAQGQFLAGTPCQFACVNGACAGECSPGSGRCNPANGVPQFCSAAGIWQSRAPCQFVCSGSGSCGGECTPGSRRCSPASGVPQLCSGAGLWQNQTPCDFICTSGTCGGDCAPGSRRCDPASGQPQLCSNAATWQNQASCARGCQNGSCIPQLGLGAPCGAARDCSSGFCVDGVCCQSACNGVCEQCAAGTGSCIMPPSDTDCDPVICASNECRLSSGNITANLCRGRGQCKSQDDCRFTEISEGTPCDAGQCDGAGNCVQRAVPCGNVSCPVNPGMCCWYRTLGIGRCEAQSAATCPTFMGAAGFDILCHSSLECPTGEICCSFSNPGGNGVVCRTSCNPASVAVAESPVCDVFDQESSPCPAGTTCSNNSSNLAPPNQGYNLCVGDTGN